LDYLIFHFEQWDCFKNIFRVNEKIIFQSMMHNMTRRKMDVSVKISNLKLKTFRYLLFTPRHSHKRETKSLVEKINHFPLRGARQRVRGKLMFHQWRKNLIFIQKIYHEQWVSCDICWFSYFIFLEGTVCQIIYENWECKVWKYKFSY
jgi:hypothetical protein